MDITPKQFSALLDELKKIRHHLEKLLQKWDEQIATVDAAEKSDENQGDVQPVWLDAILSKYKQPEADRKTEAGQQSRIHNSARWANWFTFGATLLAFIAAAYYAHWARLTYQEIAQQTPKIKEAADDATEANNRAEQSDREVRRAYISRPSGGALDSFVGEDGVPTLGINIFASGQTPAFNLRKAASFGVFKVPLTKSMPFCRDVPYTEEPYTLQNPEGDVVKTEIILSDSQKKMLESKSPIYKVVVWGNVEYTTFKEIHHSRFCYLARRDLKGGSTDKCPCQNNAD